ncbi:cytochrome c1 [Magnetococcales bacterium HHB-1]
MNFKKSLKVALTVSALLLPQLGSAGGGSVELPKVEWGHTGMFGTFDNATMKRGAQVAVEVCMACHSIKYIQFDALKQFGFTEQEVISLAEMAGRTKKDKMISAMSEADAKDAYGVVPPDLSLMTKARKGYENYTYAILTGYLNDNETTMVETIMEDGKVTEAEAKDIAAKLHLPTQDPEEVKATLTRIQNGENFNKYFPGNFFAMPMPLSADAVTYADKTKATLENLSSDVTTFLAWAAEPKATKRKETGRGVMIYLIIFTALLYAVKKRIWADVKK